MSVDSRFINMKSRSRWWYLKTSFRIEYSVKSQLEKRGKYISRLFRWHNTTHPSPRSHSSSLYNHNEYAQKRVQHEHTGYYMSKIVEFYISVILKNMTNYSNIIIIIIRIYWLIKFHCNLICTTLHTVHITITV